MPGRRLSQTEKKLSKRWNDGHGTYPRLRRLEISGGGGLRGVSELQIDFAHPVTALCGMNGTGKSTVLQLAVLAYGGTDAYVPSGTASGRSDFTFKDFFFRGPGDSAMIDVQLGWTYDGLPEESTNPLRIHRKTDKKWMHYERRPKRPVEYLGVRRIVPAVELPALRKHFGANDSHTAVSLDESCCGLLARLMRRQYEAADVLATATYAVRRVSGTNSYSSFHMASGEDVLIHLIHVLHTVPAGALVAIEEVEAALHPQAVTVLAEVLQEVALERDLQIIVTTHSEHFLDALPREGRILLQRHGSERVSVPGPTTRFAMGHMLQANSGELFVLCEDEFAVSLLTEILPQTLRSRVAIRAIGSKSALAQQARAHLLARHDGRVLLLWDGDVTDAEIRTWRASAELDALDRDQLVSYGRLPGRTAPETWVLGLLRSEGLEAFAHDIGASTGEAETILSQLAACNVHDVPRELERAASLPNEAAAVNRLCRGIRACESSVDLTDLIDLITASLEQMIDLACREDAD